MIVAVDGGSDSCVVDVVVAGGDCFAVALLHLLQLLQLLLSRLCP